MVSSANFLENLQQAENFIMSAASDGVNIIVLPEYFALMGLKETDKLEFVEDHLDGKIQSQLSHLAKRLNLWIISGTHPIRSEESGRPYGRCYVFDSQGKVVTWYDKIHLFDVNVGDNKGRYSESKYTKAGEKVVSFETPWGRVGLAVCYDLRFPELFRQLSDSGCEIVVLPAAFTRKTGEAHWDILIKARAVENLCYFIASAQGGLHENGRETWGHSMIVSPWGEVLGELSTGSGFVTATLDRQKLLDIRKEFPVLAHKKL